jgi:DNA-directed RNA polymerase specialized sigma24 family protein
MSEYELAEPSLLHRCRTVVGSLLAQYGWQLLEHEELVRRVMELLESGVVAEARPAAMHAYSLCLYTACSGADGSHRQEIGFTDLQRYLHQLSFGEHAMLAPDLRWDVINETLLRVWQKFEQCRKPGAFLAFAGYELRNAIRPWWARTVPNASLEEISDTPSPHGDADPVGRALSDELRQLVHLTFEASRERHPRAKQQLEAVWLKYIGGLDDVTIGAYLEKPVANVQVLRSRGLERLRAEPGWQLIAREFGISDR